ncbi:MAG: hypothetical protein WCY58_06755, partial [Mariniphaga sp.]
RQRQAAGDGRYPNRGNQSAAQQGIGRHQAPACGRGVALLYCLMVGKKQSLPDSSDHPAG